MIQPIEYSDFLPIWKDYIQGSDGVFNVQMVAQHFYNLGRDTAPRELSDEEVVFTANEVNVLINAIENYVCTLKSELTEEQRVFKGYERCSNVNAIVSELEDAERALEILNKASEK